MKIKAVRLIHDSFNWHSLGAGLWGPDSLGMGKGREQEARVRIWGGGRGQYCSFSWSTW